MKVKKTGKPTDTLERERERDCPMKRKSKNGIRNLK